MEEHSLALFSSHRFAAMTLAPLLPLASAAAPAAGAVASKAIDAIERLVDKLSFSELLGKDDAAAAVDAQAAATDKGGLALAAALPTALLKVGKLLSDKLSQLGVDLTRPIDLALDGKGGVGVASDHPQAKAIEAALASDPTASAALDTLLREAQGAHSASEQAGYLRLHAADPALAKQQYPHLASEHDRGVQLRLENGRLTSVPAAANR